MALPFTATCYHFHGRACSMGGWVGGWHKPALARPSAPVHALLHGAQQTAPLVQEQTPDCKPWRSVVMEVQVPQQVMRAVQ